MSDAILWKLGFGAMVLAVSLLALLTRTPPETVLEPVVVTPRATPLADPLDRPLPVAASLGPKESLVDAAEPPPPQPAPPANWPAASAAVHRELPQPAAAVAARPPAPAPVAARAAAKPRPATPPATMVAVRAPRGAIVRTAARTRPVAAARPTYVSRRPHYPFDPRHRWSGEQPP